MYKNCAYKNHAVTKEDHEGLAVLKTCIRVLHSYVIVRLSAILGGKIIKYGG